MTPNDGKCHLNGIDYNFGLLHDYPSLGQISRLVQEQSMNVIFAVTADVAKAYQAFKPLVRGSSVGVMSKDSSNVVTLVEEQYKVKKCKKFINHYVIIRCVIYYFDRLDGVIDVSTAHYFLGGIER